MTELATLPGGRSRSAGRSRLPAVAALSLTTGGAIAASLAGDIGVGDVDWLRRGAEGILVHQPVADHVFAPPSAILAVPPAWIPDGGGPSERGYGARVRL